MLSAINLCSPILFHKFVYCAKIPVVSFAVKEPNFFTVQSHNCRGVARPEATATNLRQFFDRVFYFAKCRIRRQVDVDLFYGSLSNILNILRPLQKWNSLMSRVLQLHKKRSILLAQCPALPTSQMSRSTLDDNIGGKENRLTVLLVYMLLIRIKATLP